MMKVKELRKLLESVADERLVVLASDEEGNGFYPLRDVDDNSVYDGEYRSAGIENLTPALEEQGFGPEDVGDGIPALVLWP